MKHAGPCENCSNACWWHLRCPKRSPLRIALIYAVAATLWITLSDLLLASLFSDPHLLSLAQTWKGGIFVALTAILLYELVKHDLSRHSETLRRSNERAQNFATEEQRFRRLFEDNPLPMWIYDLETLAFLAVNNAAVTRYGYSHAEFLAMSIKEIRPLEDVPNLLEHIDDLEKNATGHGEWRHRLKDGTLIDVEIISHAIDYENRPARFVVAHDITRRKRAEERMQLTQQIFDMAGEAIFVSDLDGKLLDVNAEACRLAKYTREEMLRLRNVDIVASEEVHRITPDLARCDAGQTIENRWQLLCADGSTVPLDLVVQRLPGDRYLAIGRDLTEREKVLAQLAEAHAAAQASNHAKSRFLAATSHDLRHPLLAINLFCNALSRTPLNAEQKKFSDNISLSAKNLGDVLNALLNISKLDAGAVECRNEAISVETLFKYIDNEFSSLATARSLRFKLYFPLTEMKVVSDNSLLQSLLANLIGNAIKYTEHGGILVGVRRRGAALLFQVWDTGIGIAPEYVNDIFEEYFQVDNPARDIAKGLGLGLSIARRHARLLGTDVVCRSRPGKGSVFEFRLPLSI